MNASSAWKEMKQKNQGVYFGAILNFTFTFIPPPSQDKVISRGNKTLRQAEEETQHGITVPPWVKYCQVETNTH